MTDNAPLCEEFLTPCVPMADLVAWLAAHGGSLLDDNLQLGGEPRGVYARSPIAAGDVLLSVPAALLLTAGAATRASATSETNAIILMLLEERTRGSQSTWAPWIAALPSFDSFKACLPLLWDEAHIAELLRCPAAIARARLQRTRVLALFDELVAPRPSWDDYRWAYAIVESRALYLEEASLGAERLCIAPMGDMFNHHASDPSVMASYDIGSGAFVFVATRAASAGEELCLQYGAHDNTTLFLSYGFVLGNNPHERSPLCSTEVPALSEADAEWLCENDLGDTHEHDPELAGTSSYCLTPEGASFNLHAALRLHHATATQRSTGASFSILEGEPVSVENEQLVWQSIQQLAKSRIEAFAGAPVPTAVDPKLDGQVMAALWRAAQMSLLTAARTCADKSLRKLGRVAPKSPASERETSAAARRQRSSKRARECSDV